MISLDETRLFGTALLDSFKGIIETGTLKLMAGNPNASVEAIESALPLATLPVTSLNLAVVGYQIRMTGTPKFTVLRPGKITWFMLDCRQIGVEDADAVNNGYIKGEVSYTGSSSVLRDTAELQLNTLLISTGDEGALSEITPVQFSIKLG